MFWRYTFNRWNAKRNGRRDAQFNFPPSGEAPAGYLGELQSVAEGHLLDVAERFTLTDRKLVKAIQSGIEREAHERKKLAEVEDAWKERGKKPVFPLWMHFAFIFFLMAGEYSLNEIAFRDFEDRPVQTLLMTLLVGVIILVLAHYVGRTLKKPVKSRTDSVLLVIAIIVAIGASWAVANARAKFIASKQNKPLSSSSRSVTTGLPLKADPQSSANDPAKSLWMFIIFQLGAFLAGTVTAYASADPLDEQRRRHVRTLDRREHAHTDRKKAWERHHEKSEQWRAIAKQIESAYLGENVKHRSDGTTPKCLVLIDPKTPDVLFWYHAFESECQDRTPMPVSLSGNVNESFKELVIQGNQSEEAGRESA